MSVILFLIFLNFFFGVMVFVFSFKIIQLLTYDEQNKFDILRTTKIKAIHMKRKDERFNNVKRSETKDFRDLKTTMTKVLKKFGSGSRWTFLQKLQGYSNTIWNLLSIESCKIDISVGSWAWVIFVIKRDWIMTRSLRKSYGAHARNVLKQNYLRLLW